MAPSEPPLTELRAATPESVPLLRQAAAAYAQDLGAPASVVASVQLAVSEAVTNVIMHAYVDAEPAHVELQGRLERDRLRFIVCDVGRGMKPRIDSPGIGLGLALIAQMADEVDVIDRPDEVGTKLQMWFSLSETPALIFEDRRVP